MKPQTNKLIIGPIATIKLGSKIMLNDGAIPIVGKIVYRNDLYTAIECDNLHICIIRNDVDVRLLEVVTC